MAKLKAPLFSLGASGKLGDALVFFGWKGLDVVREYVIPTNPRSDDQQTQRGYLRGGVSRVHDAQSAADNPMLGIDQVAYALWASILSKPLTWFNMAVRNYIKQKVAGLNANVYRGCTIVETSGQIEITIYNTDIRAGVITAGYFHYGTSKTNLIKSMEATINLADNEATKAITPLINGQKYFIQFRPTASEVFVGNYSGIYHGTPAA